MLLIRTLYEAISFLTTHDGLRIEGNAAIVFAPFLDDAGRVHFLETPDTIETLGQRMRYLNGAGLQADPPPWVEPARGPSWPKLETAGASPIMYFTRATKPTRGA